VWQLFSDHPRKFAKLIPARGRERIIAGIREAFDGWGIGV